ncbi:GAF domain-containing protein [Streptomyces sp. IBSNAI002]|uniref:GAF domain-containing protein n=1 Tax=Streptomyces sp. IBSNAI002 TaxID=3457500 RepID=UPI003FD267DA
MSTTLDMRQTAQELADAALHGLADIATVDLLAEIADDAAAEPADGLTGDIVVRRLGKAPAHGSPAAQVLAPPGATLHHSADAPYARAMARGDPFLVAEMNERTLPVFPGHTYTFRQLHELGAHSLLAVPLLARGKALGAAAFYRTKPAPPFSPDDVTLALDIASRAAVYLDNARLYTREHDTAVTLQRSLLPHRLTPLQGIEIAHCYRPASEANEVGGDWYDVVALSS